MVAMEKNLGLLPPQPPQWLKVLLTKKFYSDDNKCKIHDRQFETCFCKKCMNECFCHKCLNDSTHKDHDIVRVFKASGKASMSIDDLNNIWSTRKIQPFKFNGRNVIYLHERKQNYVKIGCRMCTTSIPDAVKYEFCSIECQVKYNDDDAPRSLLQNSGSNGLSSAKRRANRPHMPQRRSLKPHRNVEVQLAEEVNKAVAGDRDVSKRRHRRKGIPRRAPSSGSTQDHILYFPWCVAHCSNPLKTQHSLGLSKEVE